MGPGGGLVLVWTRGSSSVSRVSAKCAHWPCFLGVPTRPTRGVGKKSWSPRPAAASAWCQRKLLASACSSSSSPTRTCGSVCAAQTTRTCFTWWRRSTVCARCEEFARLRRLVCKQRQMLVWTKIGLAGVHHVRGSADAMRDRYQQQISGRARTWPEAVTLRCCAAVPRTLLTEADRSA